MWFQLSLQWSCCALFTLLIHSYLRLCTNPFQQNNNNNKNPDSIKTVKNSETKKNLLFIGYAMLNCCSTMGSQMQLLLELRELTQCQKHTQAV